MNKEEQVKIENLIINLNKLNEEDLKKVYWVVKGLTLTKAI